VKRRSPGEGSSYRRKSDGRWVGVWYDHTGRRRYAYAATQKDARAKAAARSHRDGPGVESVGAFLSRWLGWRAAEGTLAPSSLSSYRLHVRYVRDEIGDVALADVTPALLRDLVVDLRRTLAPSTTLSVWRTLRGALEQAVGDRLIPWNPCSAVRVGGGPTRALPPLTLDLVRAVLNAVSGDRLESLYRVGLSVGWRYCELAALGPEHVDLAAATVRCARHVVRTSGQWHILPGSKTGKVFSAPLPASTVRFVAARLDALAFERSWLGPAYADWGLLWPSVGRCAGAPLHEQQLNQHLARACSRAGVPRVTPHHFFRRGCSTLLAAEGVPARVRAAVLGHSRVATTEELYTQTLDPELRMASEVMGRLLG